MADEKKNAKTTNTTQKKNKDGKEKEPPKDTTDYAQLNKFKQEREADRKRIQTSLGEFTGSDASQTLSSRALNTSAGSIALDAAIGNAEEIRKRQHILDPQNYETEIKKPNPGKMPNNEDAYPVDLKIEELEYHVPYVKMRQVTVPKEQKEIAKDLLRVADHAEKRLVKLENVQATMMRLLFRIGARMPINCLYYGGQTPFQKYKNIRCLLDDRINEGQDMQLDQCLYCTRYEPIVGQCYEIMNDLGANVAAVMDDNQMAYSNMHKYIEQNRVEKYHMETEKASIDLAKVKTKDKNIETFSDVWGRGIAMDWHLVPKEEQKTHINWRQSITDDGSGLEKLASFPSNFDNLGDNIVSDPDNLDCFTRNKQAMDNNKDDLLKTYIETGKKEADNFGEVEEKLQMEWIKKVHEKAKTDTVTAGSMAHVAGTDDFEGQIKKFKEMSKKLSIKNAAVVLAAIGTSAEVILGNKDKKVPRLDNVLDPEKDHTKDQNDQDDQNDDSSNDSNDNKDDSKDDKDKKDKDKQKEEKSHGDFGLQWADREKWLWTDMVKPMLINMKALGVSTDLNYFPRICYLACAMIPDVKKSKLDGEKAAAPVQQKDIEKGNIAVTQGVTNKQTTDTTTTKGDASFAMERSSLRKNVRSMSASGNFHTGSTKDGKQPVKVAQPGQVSDETVIVRHTGIDFAMPIGTPVRAVMDGQVVQPGDWGTQFNAVCILNTKDDNKVMSKYLHLKERVVYPGDYVQMGQIIGYSGDFSGGHHGGTSPQLHLEIGTNGLAPSNENPADYLPFLYQFIPHEDGKAIDLKTGMPISKQALPVFINTDFSDADLLTANDSNRKDAEDKRKNDILCTYRKAAMDHLTKWQSIVLKKPCNVNYKHALELSRLMEVLKSTDRVCPPIENYNDVVTAYGLEDDLLKWQEDYKKYREDVGDIPKTIKQS